MQLGTNCSVGPLVTKIALADTREAKVLTRRGPGTGLVSVAGRHWRTGEAHGVVAHARDLGSKQLDRVILVAGPMRLGLRIDAMDRRLKHSLVDELVKDLIALPV